MAHQLNRRQILQAGAAAGAALAFPTIVRSQAASSAKVNVAFIGVGGRGGGDLNECAASGCNVVALCDIDGHRLASAAKRFPQAKTYSDYRQMFDKQNDYEAVCVGTPDQHHFPASMRAIKMGKHVYCEKPLTHSVWEARQIAEATKKSGVATQMGTQGHATERFRLLVEWVQAGIIGAVREVHIWTDRPAGWWPQGVNRPEGEDPVPSHINWDAWIGPAQMRPFVSTWKEGPHKGRAVYHDFVWRGWWDFGTGAMGDIGCHALDLPFSALKLGAPSSVWAFQTGNTAESAPLWSDIVYEFPAAGDRSALKLFWYDGRNDRTSKGSSEYRAFYMLNQLAERPADRPLPFNGQLYIGDKGKLLLTGDNAPRLVPESLMKDFKPPAKTLQRLEGKFPHHLQWLKACKSGDTTGSNFAYAGPLAEAVLLGNISIRLGKRLEWDSSKLQCANAPEAQQYIRREYRKGWEV